MKITRFEELAEKAVPWFMAVCLAVILWAVTGCGGNSGTNTASSDPDPSDFSEIRQVLVDDCEYLIWQRYRVGNIIHKANCKNPIHKCE